MIAKTHTQRLTQNIICVKCIITDVDSLPHFATDFLCFHPLTDSFLQNRGVEGYMTNLINSKVKPPKGREPRTAWGEAIRGLGVIARTGP